MPYIRRKGIYCIEGKWWPDRIRQDSVKPTLDLLDQSVCYNTPHLHHRTETKDYAQHLLREWLQARYSAFPILVLAFHGKPGQIIVSKGRGASRYLTIEELGDLLAGSCKGCIIHFSSCETIDVDRKRLEAFLKRTKAAAVSGFRFDIEWLHSAAFEILYLGALQNYSATAQGMRAVERVLRKQVPTLMRMLGFRIVVRSGR